MIKIEQNKVTLGYSGRTFEPLEMNMCTFISLAPGGIDLYQGTQYIGM